MTRTRKYGRWRRAALAALMVGWVLPAGPALAAAAPRSPAISVEDPPPDTLKGNKLFEGQEDPPPDTLKGGKK